MCMDPIKVIELIAACMKYKQARMLKEFDEAIAQLEKALQGVIIGEIDYSALVHSFL